jgi:DNA-binding response OmpR family regulator
MSGRAVEAAGDVDVLLLDKTGTITLGNRQATKFIPAKGVAEQKLAEAAHLASMADETAEGRSIAVLAKKQFGLRGRELEQIQPHFVPFSARTRMSGVTLDGQEIRKGAADAVESHIRDQGGVLPDDVRSCVKHIAQAGGTPLVVSLNAQVLGVIELKDIVKGGIKERFAELRHMGIKTVTAPVIILSVRDQEEQKIESLDHGADDYITKPFGIGELLARMRTALRHAHQAGTATSTITIGDLRVDLSARRVFRREEEVHLTPLEYKLIVTMLKHSGKVLTHRFLLKEVWGPHDTHETHYLRVFVASLRRKLEDDPARPCYILTEPGVGYRFASE